MTYTFPFYIPAIAFLIGVAAAGFGVFNLVRKASPRTTIVAFVVAVLAGGLFGPMLALDRVVLDDERLQQTTGFWFAPTVKGFQFADVDFVEVTIAQDRKGRDYELWVVHKKDGAVDEIDPGDLWVVNDEDIIRRLREKGVDVR